MFGEEASASVTSSATSKLFKVRGNVKELSYKKGIIFHVVATEL